MMTHLTMFHKSPTYASVKIYKHLPADIKDLEGDIEGFKQARKFYLHVHTFYTMDRFFTYTIR
jgi:hypothetical protein